MNRVTLAILLLFSAALVLYWQVQLKQGEFDKKLQLTTSEPDFVADDLHSVEFDDKGRLNSRVTASHMEHYEDKALTYFTAPVYLVYPVDGKAQWRLQASEGRLDKNSGKVTLENNVIIDAISPEEPIQTLSTSQLELDLDTMIMTSDRLITITGAGFIIQGTGLNADLNAQEVSLTSQIKGTYEAK
jgi:lipopolysaccharide export system protein LptC